VIGGGEITHTGRKEGGEKGKILGGGGVVLWRGVSVRSITFLIRF